MLRFVTRARFELFSLRFERFRRALLAAYTTIPDRGTHRIEVDSMRDQDWIADRAAALTVPCVYCHAPIGERCVVPERLGGPLELIRFPAHLPRIKAAKAVTA